MFLISTINHPPHVKVWHFYMVTTYCITLHVLLNSLSFYPHMSIQNKNTEIVQCFCDYRTVRMWLHIFVLTGVFVCVCVFPWKWVQSYTQHSELCWHQGDITPRRWFSGVQQCTSLPSSPAWVQHLCTLGGRTAPLPLRQGKTPANLVLKATC